MKKIVFLVLILILKFAAYSQDTYYITVDDLNLREGAGKNYKVIITLRKGDPIKIISFNNDWSYVIAKDTLKGYVSTQFISKTINNENNNTNSNNKVSESRTKWGEVIVLVLIVIAIVYKMFGQFGISKGSSPSTTKTTVTKPKKRFYLEINDGNIHRKTENNTGREYIYSSSNAIDCDLENEFEDKTRFLVVTNEGKVLLCETKSTGVKFVFNPFVSYGSAYRAKFCDSNSFYFDTEKGKFKGYFNSTRIDKL